MKKDAYK